MTAIQKALEAQTLARIIYDAFEADSPDDFLGEFAISEDRRRSITIDGGFDLLAIAKRILAATEGRIPQGWQVVPKEPTPEMWAAGDKADWVGEIEGRTGYSIRPTERPPGLEPDEEDWVADRRGIWAAMLAAAPPPPSGEPG